MLRLIKTCMKRNRHLIRFTSMVAVLFPTALLSAGCGTKEQEEAIVQKSESVLSASSVVSEDSPVVEDLVSTSALTISNYVEIEFDGEPYIFDTEIEYKEVTIGGRGSSYYKVPYWKAERWYYNRGEE